MAGTDPTEPHDPTKGARAGRSFVRAVSNRRRVVWVAVGLVVVCVLALRVFGVVGPRQCTSCHNRPAFRAATQSSPHASVECRACHVPAGVAAGVAFALQRPLHEWAPRARATIRDAAAVPDERCIACHAQVLQNVVVADGLRVNHATCATTAACTDCHSSTAHGGETQWVRSYDMEACLACHLISGEVACDLCHEGKGAADRVKFAAFDVTHGPKWKSTHGMGDIATCTVCHAADDCADCHGAGVPHGPTYLEVHAADASKETAQCESCHTETFCSGCHGTEMPHPSGFTRRHPTASKREPDLCPRCHDESDCTNCHVKHVHPGGAVDAGTPGGAGDL